MNKKDRKAWLRVVEAFIAVLIIMGAVLVVISRQDARVDITESVYERQTQILNIVSKNDELRSQIIEGEKSGVNEYISKMIPSSWDFATNICDIDAICPNPINYLNKDIYTTEVIITSTLTDYNPKKLRFFVWMK